MLMLAVSIPAALADEKNQSEKPEGDSAKKEKKEESPIPRLAEMRIDEFVVAARTINLPIPGRTRTVQEVLDRLDKWSEEDKIGAVLMDLTNVALSIPDVEEIRAAVDRLQKSGKKVHAFVNGGGPLAYLLACTADEIAIAPTGNVLIPGLGALFPYLKGHYQMLGLEYDVITAGRYKYPGFLNRREPDKYFREEYGAILDSWFSDYKRFIAEGRNLTDKQVAEAIDIALFDADRALQTGLVDTLAFYHQYREQILRREKMKRYQDGERGLAKVNSIQDLMELINEELKKAEESREDVGPKIAVLHARGPIVDFNLGPGFASLMICRDDFVKVVNELRKNKSIKAVVMRVDSPGGSGYASDVIWQNLRRLGEEKPLVVTMGTVAGSGGYYIACPAARIFAQPTTITGSIGVLGIFQSAWSRYNRMDYEMVPMHRGARALLGAPHRPLDKEDRAFIQKYMNDFYSIFIDRVATTRKIPAQRVREIAEGRIYTGRQALDLRLVDELGGLEDAIEAARTLANIPPSAELKIVHYPRPSSLGEIFESVGMMGAETVLARASKGLTAATPIGFEQQLSLFSRQPQVLCWMAVPPFYTPQALSSWHMTPLAPPAPPLQELRDMLTPTR
jgi:protease-4